MKNIPSVFVCCCILVMAAATPRLMANKSIAVINYKDEIAASDCIVTATLDEKPSSDHDQKVYLIRPKQTLKGTLGEDAFLVVQLNLDSMAGSPPIIQANTEYLLFLADTKTSVLALLAPKTYKLTANWKGIMPTREAGAETRTAANVLKNYNVDPYDDMPSFLQAIAFGVSSNEEARLSDNARKIVIALELQQPSSSGR